jgi:hypothetical protein
MIKKLIRSCIATGKLTIGFVIFAVTRKTPNFAFQSMIQLFCLTGGRASKLLSSLISLVKKPYDFGNMEGVLGLKTPQDKAKVVNDLRERGYHVFDARLPDELCDRLLEYATTSPCTSRPMDGQGNDRAVKGIYPRGKPEVARYDFSPQDLLGNKDVQNLLADLSFAGVAQDYLQARPIIDILSMWWHTDFSDKPDMDAAQYYHFDMDRPNWVKFFVYLTDVTADSGPHTFVAGSHKVGGIPNSMLKKGYARLTDEEVEAFYDKKDIIEYTAPRGTIIAEDTRGLHKGKHVAKGDRLILQIQFSNSLFGMTYPKATLGKNLTEELSPKIREFPDLYSAYL